MKISKIIKMLEEEMADEGDVELVIYDYSGGRIEPKSFSYGGMSTDVGFVDTVAFSAQKI